jgi:hypothetical protein
VSPCDIDGGVVISAQLQYDLTYPSLFDFVEVTGGIYNGECFQVTGIGTGPTIYQITNTLGDNCSSCEI